MKIISENHLTQQDIKSIKLLIDSGFKACKIGRTNWAILEKTGNYYTIGKQVTDRGLGFVGSEKRLSTYKFKIKVI